MMFNYLVNDIKYFASIHLITEEEVTKLQEELLKLLDDLETIASKGKFDTGKDIHIYIYLTSILKLHTAMWKHRACN